MYRRKFISLCFVLLGALSFWPKLLFGRSGESFQPDMYYGAWIEAKDWAKKGKSLKLINQNMCKMIPPNYRTCVTFHIKKPGSSGDALRQRGTVGWKYTPKNPRKDQPEIDSEWAYRQEIRI